MPTCAGGETYLDPAALAANTHSPPRPGPHTNVRSAAFRYTGMGLLNPDGSRYHGIGIRPTVELALSAADYRDGIGRALRTAIEILDRSASPPATALPRATHGSTTGGGIGVGDGPPVGRP